MRILALSLAALLAISVPAEARRRHRAPKIKVKIVRVIVQVPARPVENVVSGAPTVLGLSDAPGVCSLNPLPAWERR